MTNPVICEHGSYYAGECYRCEIARLTARIAELEQKLAIKRKVSSTMQQQIESFQRDNVELRESLVAIAEMKPREVEFEIPDHSECSECKRIKSLAPYHPSKFCDSLYRALRERAALYEREYHAQQYRMRDIARAAIDDAGEE